MSEQNENNFGSATVKYPDVVEEGKLDEENESDAQNDEKSNSDQIGKIIVQPFDDEGNEENAAEAQQQIHVQPIDEENDEKSNTNKIGKIIVQPFNDENNEENAAEAQQQIHVQPIDEENDENNNPAPENQQNAQPNERVNNDQNEGQREIPVPPPEQDFVPEDEYNPEDDDRIWLCPICMEEIHDPVVTPCGHVYCKRCIQEWLRRNQVCPTCNKNGIRISDLMPIEGIGLHEDRPPPDNTLEANTLPKRIMRLLKNHVFRKETLVFIAVYFFFTLSFLIQ